MEHNTLVVVQEGSPRQFSIKANRGKTEIITADSSTINDLLLKREKVRYQVTNKFEDISTIIIDWNSFTGKFHISHTKTLRKILEDIHSEAQIIEIESQK